MAESTAAPAIAPADLADRFSKFQIEVFPKASTRAEIVAQLANWLEQRGINDDGPDELPNAMVLACEDLRRDLDEVNDYVHQLGLDVRKALEQA